VRNLTGSAYGVTVYAAMKDMSEPSTMSQSGAKLWPELSRVKPHEGSSRIMEVAPKKYDASRKKRYRHGHR